MKLASRSRRANGRKAAALLLGSSLLIAFICLGASVLSAFAGQSGQQAKETQPDLKPFLGTWKASFKGEVFAILVVREERGNIAGTLNNFDIGRDKDGNLNDDTHKDFGDGPLLNVRVKSGALYFVAIQKDQYAPSTEWKFVPKNAQEGELTQLIDGQPYSPNGSVPKPILMIRERAKQP
ncbi:MAG: hypothetical protein ABR973_15245 [Candidatus Acidiferrales bacterium]|jgi:hypothetical protein